MAASLVGLALPAAVGMAPTAAGAAARISAQVWVTGYVDRGYTASGVYTHPGSCAVDPRVIPLGTYITIEGLGTCHAEDTGSAVIGYHVDVWVATVAEAYAITGYRTATWTPASQQVLGFHAGAPAVPTPQATAAHVTPTPQATVAHATPAPQATAASTQTSSRATPSTVPLYITWTPVARAATATPVPPTASVPTPKPVSTPRPTQGPASTPTSYVQKAYATWTPSAPVSPSPSADAMGTPSAGQTLPHLTPTPSSTPNLTTRATSLAGSSCKTIHWAKKIHGIRYFYYRTICGK